MAMVVGNGGFEKVTQNTERKPETVHESQLMYWFYNMQWNDPYVFLTNTIGETTKNIDYQGLEQSDLQYKCAPTIVADMYASWRPRLHNVIGDNLGVLNRKQKSYFYHNDHLGSTKLVMDGYGHICNEIDYMPFGETFHPDRGYLEKHKFTGKERDEETQYDYFGARYYWSAAKHWLSVDPLSDKYPGISPYAYCGWNPINYVDPNGKKIEVAGSLISCFLGKIGIDNFQGKTYRALDRLRNIDPNIRDMISQLEASATVYTIKPTTQRPDNGIGNAYDPKTNTIYFDPDNVKRKNGEIRDPIVGLAHELGHAEDDNNGKVTQYDKNNALNGDVVEIEKLNENEKNAIQRENIVRERLNLPQRNETYLE